MKKVIKFSAVILTVVVIGLGVFLKTCYVVPVIMYHAINYNDKVNKLSVSPESFARQMEFLHKYKYNVVTLDKIASYLQKKEKIPPRTVAITFDDGFYNNYQYAYPVLKKYNIPATIFVIVNKIGQEGYLNWENIKEMSDSGIITIGSHTMSHAWLPDTPTLKLRDELSRSRKILEDKLGKRVELLCYPIGAHNDRVKREARTAGYECAVGTNPGKLSPLEDVYSIKRIKISRTSDNLLVFWFETSGYYTWFKEFGDH